MSQLGQGRSKVGASWLRCSGQINLQEFISNRSRSFFQPPHPNPAQEMDETPVLVCHRDRSLAVIVNAYSFSNRQFGNILVLDRDVSNHDKRSFRRGIDQGRDRPSLCSRWRIRQWLFDPGRKAPTDRQP